MVNIINWVKKLMSKKDNKMEFKSTSRDEDVPKFIELKINTWKELIDFFDKFNWSANFGRDWIFRGESDESRTMSPSLERLYKDSLGSMSNAEKLSLSYFKRRYKGEFKPNNSLEWLSLLQHYGAPTRLVDFTYSWYIALFFAIESLSSSNSSLWCINLQELKNGIKIYGINPTASHPIIFDAYEKEVCELIDNHSKEKRFVIPVEPQLLNERIHIQQGLFLINGSFLSKFDDILFQTLSVDKTQKVNKKVLDVKTTEIEEVTIFKIVINASIKKDLIKELYKMNISRETIYPGIEGFSQSIKTRIQAGIFAN
jgi:hypothetical protein